MSLHFLIDGYNAIRRIESLRCIRILEDARMSLIEFIQANGLAGSKNNRVTIVFDGKEGFDIGSAQNKGVIKIIFSRGESADETIKRLVEISSNPKQIVVVTDDRAIVFSTKAFGVNAMSISEFFSRVKKRSVSRAAGQKNIESKLELTYQQREAINLELKKFWK